MSSALGLGALALHRVAPVVNPARRQLLSGLAAHEFGQPRVRRDRCCVQTRAVLSSIRPAAQPAPNQACAFENASPLAYEIVKGPLGCSYDGGSQEGTCCMLPDGGQEVQWCQGVNTRPPPTAVLLHGILGSRRNLQAFAKRIVENHPAWQVVLVDLRCHGESAALQQLQAPHTVHSSAQDVLQLLNHLRLFPTLLIGHSFGGKVVLSMTQQFGSQLPRPVQVWVLDSLPGNVRAGGGLDGTQDHPQQLIECLRRVPVPVPSRQWLRNHLLQQGFSRDIPAWVTTNLRPGPASRAGQDLLWTFDLGGIRQMYGSYERESLWPLLRAPPQGLTVDFVRAERSEFRWAATDQQLLCSLGHRVHLLCDAGHWVHIDNPAGLLSLMAPSFESHLRR